MSYLPVVQQVGNSVGRIELGGSIIIVCQPNSHSHSLEKNIAAITIVSNTVIYNSERIHRFRSFLKSVFCLLRGTEVFLLAFTISDQCRLIKFPTLQHCRVTGKVLLQANGPNHSGIWWKWTSDEKILGKGFKSEVLMHRYHFCYTDVSTGATGRELCSKNAMSSLNYYPVHTAGCTENCENANSKSELAEVENALEFAKRINALVS